MDLSFSRHIWRFALLVGMLFLALSCIMDKDFPMDEEWMGKEAVLFNVLAEPASKLSYEGVHTSFVNGESVGCIIAEKNGEGFTFGVSTKWTYQDGALKLESDDNEYVARHMEDGYVTLVKPEVDYAFFFYYPYSESVTESNWMSLERTVLTDFSGDEGTTVSRLSASDHLWTRHLHGVATTGMKTVNLTFQKKTATVEIHCDDGDEDDYKISDVWLDAVSGSAGVQTEMHMNLTSGTLTVSDTEKGHDGLIKPGLIHEEEGSIHESGYRMIFVPQTILSWRLHATINEGGDDKVYNIALEDKLRTLEEGKLYIFHVAKAGDGYILINDWNSDNTDNLIGEEVDVPTDLTMWAQPLHSPEKIDGAVVIKAGDNLIIKGKKFWKTDHCIVDKVQLEGARVFAYSQDNQDGFVLSEDSGDGYRTITFKLPDTAKDGPVYLVMPSGVMVSPGNIYTVKPEVTELTPESVDMINEYVPGTSAITLTGTDLDLVEKVIFGGDYAVDADPSDDGTSLTALIPQFAQTGNIRLVLKNGLVIDSGKLFTVENPQEEVKVTSVSGRFSAGETITVKGLHLSETGKIHLTGADSQTIVLDKTEDFKIDGDGTITFEFPAEARDGSMTFFKGSSLIWIPVQIGSQEAADNYPYETLMPSYLEVQKIDDKLYVYGKDLDVIGTVTLNSSTVGDAHIEGSEIYFNWDEKLKGNIRLTSKNGKYVDLPYDFTPTAPIVTSISAPQGNLTKTVVDANGQAQEVEDPLGIKVGAGDEVILHGSYLNLATKVRVRDQVIETFTVNGENTALTFTFASVSMNGYIYLITESGVEVNVGRYELAGSVSVTEVNGIFKSGNQVTLTGEYLGRITSIDVSDVDGTTNKVTLADGYDDVDFDVSDDGKSLTFNYPEAGQNNGTGKLVFYSGTVPVGEYLAEGLNVTEYGRYGNEIYLYGENLEGATVKLNDATLNPSYDSGNGRLVIDHSKSGNEAARTYEGTFVVSTKHGCSVEQAFDFYPEVSSYSPQPVSPGQDLTISGENLDLMNCVVFDENNSVYVNLPNPSDEAYGQVTLTVPAGSTGSVKFRLVTGNYHKPENAGLEVNPLNGDELLIWNGSEENVTFVPESENWAKVKAGDRLIVYTGSNDNYNKDWSFILKDGVGNALVGTETYKNSTGVLITLTSEMIEQINVNNGINITLENGFVNKVSVLTRALPAGITVTSIKSERDKSEDTVVEAKANDIVTITGTGLSGITKVKVNGLDVNSWLSGEVRYFTVPDTGDGDIEIVTSSGDFVVGQFVTVVPTNLSVGRDGTSMYVTGNDLDMISSIEGITVNNFYQDSEKMRIIVQDTDKVKGEFIVKNKYGKSAGPLSYDFTPDNISYDKQSVTVGYQLTVSGTNMNLVKSVTFAGGTSTTPYEGSLEKFKLNIPSGTETGELTFILVDDTEVTGPILTIEGSAPAQPNVESITRNGWTNLYINGTDLDKVTSLSLNGGSLTENTDFSKNASQIQIYLGSGSIDNQYKILKGAVLLNGNIEAEYDFTPKASFSDNNPKNVGDNITLTGTDLDLVENVVFTTSNGTHAGTKQSYTLTEIIVTIPNNAVSGTVWLDCSDPADTQVEVGNITIGSQSAPVISNITRSGDDIYVNGSGFTDLTSVVLNGGALQPQTNYTVNNDGTVITIDVYSGVTQGITGTVEVTNESGSVSSDYNFTPTIGTIDKLSVSVGETVTITGTNLDLVLSVIFANGFTENNVTAQAEILTFKVPSEAQSGKITLSCVDGGTTKVTSENEITIVDTPVVDPDPGTGDGEFTKDVWVDSKDVQNNNWLEVSASSWSWAEVDPLTQNITVVVEYEYYKHNEDPPLLGLYNGYNTLVQEFSLEKGEGNHVLNIDITSDLYNKLTWKYGPDGMKFTGNNTIVKRVSVVVSQKQQN